MGNRHWHMRMHGVNILLEVNLDNSTRPPFDQEVDIVLASSFQISIQRSIVEVWYSYASKQRFEKTRVIFTSLWGTNTLILHREGGSPGTRKRADIRGDNELKREREREKGTLRRR